MNDYLDDYEDYNDPEEAYEAGLKKGSNNGSGCGWLGWVVIFIILYLIFGRDIGKYEGMTAEEWFNEYDYESGRYEDLLADYEELQDEFDGLESCLKRINYSYYREADDIEDDVDSCLRRYSQ